MAKKESKPTPVRMVCTGIDKINGLDWPHNPAHETNKSLLTRRGLCVYCKGVTTAAGRWFGREQEWKQNYE